MATHTFTGHTLAINGSNINVTTGATFTVVLTDDDPTIGDPGDTGEMVSIDGGAPQNYTFLGIGLTDSGENIAVIELADGSLIGFNTNGTTLQNGNTKVALSELVDDPVVPCFTPGSMILTPAGYVAIEDLEVGDLILTRDNGAQPIRKILKRHLSGAALTPNLKPIRIKKDAFGPNVPFADLTVSPQHRFSIADWRTELLFGETDMLICAKSLCNDRSVVTLADVHDVTYIHLVLDTHELIAANGAATETVLVSEAFLNSMPFLARLELEELFGCGLHENAPLHAAAAPILLGSEGTFLTALAS